MQLTRSTKTTIGMSAKCFSISSDSFPRPKCFPKPFQKVKPVTVVTTPNANSCQVFALCRSKSPASPIWSNDPMPRYRPFAMKQNPVKNFAKKECRGANLIVMSHKISGNKQPTMGPIQLTIKGRGFGDTSVREMVSGCSSTWVTCPPVVQVAKTCQIHAQSSCQAKSLVALLI